jgi:4a-hydroxytetrahydrobiopterin dehydratase
VRRVDKPRCGRGDARIDRRWSFDVDANPLTFGSMTKPLSDAEITVARGSLTGWSYDNNALTKTFSFETFREAMGFMLRVGFEAEALNHHPDWSNVYNRVVVRLNTHDAGGKVTAKDVELAKRIQKISWVG